MNNGNYLSNAPLYFQVSETIRQKIASGEYRPHDMLPSEPELGKIYGVSRYTIRHALAVLLKERLIYVQQGIGTYVNNPPQRCEHCGQVLPVGKQQSKAVTR